MMFSCCHPRLTEEAQVALVLHILCGFSVNEIANAFVSSDAAIEKRISRAKKVLAGSKRLFDVSGADDFSGRLPAVQRALYLLFNEGYHGASPESAVRAELCQEASVLRRCFFSTFCPAAEVRGVPSNKRIDTDDKQRRRACCFARRPNTVHHTFASTTGCDLSCAGISR